MILAIGNPVYDYIKTPRVDTEHRILSGCSTNAALALAKLGKEVKLVGSIGVDYLELFAADLKRFHIQSEVTLSKETGGFSLVYFDNFGNRTLDLLGRASNIADLPPTLYADSEAILIGPILGEISHDQIRDIRKNYGGLFFCDPQGLLRTVDRAGRIHHEKIKGIEEVLGLFDIVKPNELEAQILTGIDCRQDPYKAARIIKSWGPKIVIVTLAELGSLIYDGSQFINIPPYEIDLIDATGAGDTYMAGFTFEYLKTGGELFKSGCFASATSSIMIEQVGPDFVMTESLVRVRQVKLLRMTNFKPQVAINL